MELNVDIARDIQAPARARRAVRRLGEDLDPALIDDVMLLVSELITNSVKYGGEGELQLAVRSEGAEHVRIEVIDQGSGFVPTARDRPKSEAGGWGLHLVEEMTDRWGVHEGSTHVWFEIDRREAGGD
jgi:anti-sigma regulatory factor (Ser/Thr protein kinase)